MTFEIDLEIPLDHQLVAAKKLGKRSFLFDMRGLGKTWSSLLWAEFKGAKRVGVIAPKEVAENFLEEIKLRYPNKKPIPMISKNPYDRIAILTMLSVLDEFVVVVNLEAWRKDKSLINDLASLQLDTIIIDEAHNIKDSSTVSFRGVRDIVYAKNACKSCGSPDIQKLDVGYFCMHCFDFNEEASSSVDKVQMLTGTPILNAPYDLFPLLHLYDKNRFPNLKNYLYLYCYQGYDSRWRFRPGAEKQIIEFMGDNLLARNLEDAGIKLPKHDLIPYHLDFNEEDYPDQWKFYKQIKEAAAIQIAEDQALSIVSLLALITRLRQAIVYPAGMHIGDWKCDIEKSIKMDNAFMLGNEMLDENIRVVINSQFKPPLRKLEKMFDAPTVVLDGATPDWLRREIRTDFDRRFKQAKWRVLLANYKVGGESWNFTAATGGILLDSAWSPGRQNQAIGRRNRIGQTEESLTYKLIAEPSIDLWQEDLLKYKQAIVENFDEVRDSLKEYLEAA